MVSASPNVTHRFAGWAAGSHNGRSIAGITLALVLGACSTDAAVGVAGRPAALRRVSGSGQTGQPGAALDRPLVARVVDAGGHPVQQAEVRWSVSAGEVDPPISVTDANGDAWTTWRLGTEPGAYRAIAEADGMDGVEFVAFVDPTAIPDRIALHALPLETYDGSGQAVHPDVVVPPFAALDGRARLAITPYPWGNAALENPSLFVARDRSAWAVPDGVTNPIVRPKGGYLSDPDVLYDPDTRELRLYYRHVDEANHIVVATSRDGATFSEPVVVASAPSHQIVSPTVVRRSAGEWLMWSVNSGGAGCTASSTTVELRRSADGLTWSMPRAVSLSQPGVFPWHIEVQWVNALDEYWALFNGKVSGSCTTDALYIATSKDGVSWRTYRSPVLRAGVIPELRDVVYRATFAYDAERDLVALWHSGARYTDRGYEWRAAYERRRRVDLFEAVAKAEGSMVARVERQPQPPLDNRTAP